MGLVWRHGLMDDVRRLIDAGVLGRNHCADSLGC